MKSTEEYLIALLAEMQALREAVASRQCRSRRSMRGVKPADLAADLGVHPRTIVRAIEDGRIVAIPCGKSWSISRKEAERIKMYGLSAPRGTIA